MFFIVSGSNARPAETIRTEATWYDVSATNPAFIRIKELPQTIERRIKISQLIKVLLTVAVKGRGYIIIPLYELYIFPDTNTLFPQCNLCIFKCSNQSMTV